MDIPQLCIGLGILGIAGYGITWAVSRVQSLPKAKTAPDALATFNSLVEALRANSKLDEAVEASVIAIREAVAEICMPLDSDAEVTP